MADFEQIAREIHPDAIERQSFSASVALREKIAAALREADAAGEARGVAAERERCAAVAARYSSMKRRWQRKVDRLGLQNGGALARAQSDAAQEILKAICAEDAT